MSERTNNLPRQLTLRAGGTMIVFDAAVGERARILFAGPDLGEVDPADFPALADRQHAPGGPEQPIASSLLNCIGTGHPSPPGLLAHSQGRHWALDPRVTSVETPSENAISIITEDAVCHLVVRHEISIDTNGVLSISSRIANGGDEKISIDWLATLCMPLDNHFTRLTSFTGRWAQEFQSEQHDLVRGTFLRENRAGRTSHDSYPGLYLGSPTTDEQYGPACAVHLAWSGNHRMRVDRLADDTLSLQAGELLLPGEIDLAPGKSYSAPAIAIGWSNRGYGDLTRRFHGYASHLREGRKVARPIHYNTWEAVYFDHSPERLMALADQAAAVGAERFVLDDGWFGARRNDRAGLGDWFVSQDVYPDGLKPLADHVRSLGMEFGLWFEPEMVNPDSDLFREHPDWVLKAGGVDTIASRHQLPLDLTRAEVTDYLFERIDTLLREIGVGYIKWDMNRDIQHPGGADGRPAMHRQICALYDLIDRIRRAHPDLVIESCSSGGARADYCMLARSDRVWTSDNNDARARHAIMRGAAHFLPLEVLGNHVGPKRCHITGRRFDMAFRAGTAVFGHMGMELDLSDESEADRNILAAAIKLHKHHRDLIHSGDYQRLETQPHISAIGAVSADRSEALYQVAILDQHPATHPPRIRFAGLDPKASYTVQCVWPKALEREPLRVAGSALIEYGLQLPLTYPDTCLIYHLETET